jgi:hypothetical protein
VGVALDVGLDDDERLDVGGQPVRHELKVAVRRDKRDGAVCLKARQTHTLVELDILELNRLALASCTV